MISRKFAADFFLPTAEQTSDVQENHKDVQENNTNLAEAPLVDCLFDSRLFSADSAHAENPSMKTRRTRGLCWGERQECFVLISFIPKQAQL